MPIFLRHIIQTTALCSALLAISAPHAMAEIVVQFNIAQKGLEKYLQNSSALWTKAQESEATPADIFAASRADYRGLINALYAKGYYAPVIHILLDGQEAALIAPLNAPKTVRKVVVSVDPGPEFHFGHTRIIPLPRQNSLPEEFKTGEAAKSDVIKQALERSIESWRDLGYAKATITAQDIAADHRSNSLDVAATLAPGPRLRFGRLIVQGQKTMRPERIAEIAGLPEGVQFSPDLVKRSAERLRRTGVFSSATLRENDAITAPDRLDITATVVEEKQKRYSIGGEVASSEGMNLTGYWLHRNLLGGGERLKVEGNVDNIGAQTSGVDYKLDITLERPATLTPDSTFGLKASIGHLNEEDYNADIGEFGLSLNHYISDQLNARAGLNYSFSRVTDDISKYDYQTLSLPIGAEWDKRDSKLDPKKGYYLNGEFKPFFGIGDETQSGMRIMADGRSYISFGEKKPATFAARAQFGMISGSDLLQTPRDFLFYSGGAGTVRGQPYQSLGVDIDDLYGAQIGGKGFAALSGEIRARVTPKIGVVGFVDAGYISALKFGDGYSDWHAGAGLGMRYETGIGPIRLDVAAPVGGDTGDGMQFYLGIGQAF